MIIGSIFVKMRIQQRIRIFFCRESFLNDIPIIDYQAVLRNWAGYIPDDAGVIEKYTRFLYVSEVTLMSFRKPSVKKVKQFIVSEPAGRCGAKMNLWVCFMAIKKTPLNFTKGPTD